MRKSHELVVTYGDGRQEVFGPVSWFTGTGGALVVVLKDGGEGEVKPQIGIPWHRIFQYEYREMEENEHHAGVGQEESAQPPGD